MAHLLVLVSLTVDIAGCCHLWYAPPASLRLARDEVSTGSSSVFNGRFLMKDLVTTSSVGFEASSIGS